MVLGENGQKKPSQPHFVRQLSQRESQGRIPFWWRQRAKRDGEGNRQAALLTGRVWCFNIGTTQQVIDADPVKIGQSHENINGIIQYSQFILGVGVLFDIDDVGNLCLSISFVDAKISDAFKF